MCYEIHDKDEDTSLHFHQLLDTIKFNNAHFNKCVRLEECEARTQVIQARS